MGLIQRYMLRVFLKNVVVSTALVLLLFFLIDFSSQLGRFAFLKRGLLSFVFHYYRLKIPLTLYELAIVVWVIAVTVTVVKFQKSRELLALVGFGYSLRRLFIPFIVILGAGCIGLFFFKEKVLTRESVDYFAHEQALRFGGIPYVKDMGWVGPDHSLMTADKYFLQEKRLEGFGLVQRQKGGSLLQMQAKTVVWEEGKIWRVFEGEEWVYRRQGGVQHRPLKNQLLTLGFTPRDMIQLFQLPQGLSMRQLSLQMKAKADPSFPLEYWKRWIWPLFTFLLSLLMIPVLLYFDVHQWVKGMGLVLILSLLFYGIYFLSVQWVQSGIAPACIILFIPLFFFLPPLLYFYLVFPT